SNLRKSYDLVALKTRDIDLFEKACVGLKVDLISFHFDERIPFELNPLFIKKAIERNVYFEICYAPTIKDQQTRLYTLQIAKQLFDLTTGNYWILSSGTEAVSDIRNPSDIFYL
ncbi:RNase P subunit p30, partial [Sporodiniella umbellata]